MLEIASLTVSISKLRHYTNFSDRPPLSQYPGSALVLSVAALHLTWLRLLCSTTWFRGSSPSRPPERERERERDPGKRWSLVSQILGDR